MTQTKLIIKDVFFCDSGFVGLASKKKKIKNVHDILFTKKYAYIKWINELMND